MSQPSIRSCRLFDTTPHNIPDLTRGLDCAQNNLTVVHQALENDPKNTDLLRTQMFWIGQCSLFRDKISTIKSHSMMSPMIAPMGD